MRLILFLLFLSIYAQLPSQYKVRLLQSKNKRKIIIGFLIFKIGFAARQQLKSGVKAFPNYSGTHVIYQASPGETHYMVLCNVEKKGTSRKILPIQR